MRSCWRWSWRQKSEGIYEVTAGQRKDRFCEQLVLRTSLFPETSCVLDTLIKTQSCKLKVFVPRKTHPATSLQCSQGWTFAVDDSWLGNAFFHFKQIHNSFGQGCWRRSWMCWVLSASFFPAVDKIPSPGPTWGWILQRQSIAIN